MSDQSQIAVKELEQKCKFLEGKCTEYVKELEKTNRQLKAEIRNHERTASELQDSELRFRKIFEYAPFGAAMTAVDGKIKLANKVLCDRLGYRRNELENMHFTEITFADDIDKDLNLFKKLANGEIDHYNIEKRYISKTGKVIWGSLAVTVVQEAVSMERMIIGMVEDITKRKKAEYKLKKAHDNLEDIVAQRTSEIQRLKERLQAENIYLKQELADSHHYGTIIGQSHSIKSVISQIELVSPTKSNVLILGGSGTGKELVAREIHKHSSRSEQPFIKVNCAAIPKDLYESEFFGHVKGAFTGAVTNRLGRFEAADGGTIFLDEVGEIPLDLQSKLLRVLQDGEYERLGEEKTRRVDVRIIAASNKDLKKEVEDRRFRDDLFYRLNVFPINVSSLKERIDDIPLLVVHFIEKHSRLMNLSRPQLTKANIMDLQKYEWPGNVRELENAVERAMILSRSKKLNFSFLFDRESAPAIQGLAVTSKVDPETILSSSDLFELQRNNMVKALTYCNWKIYGDDGASALLDIKPTTLIERMKRMNITKPR